MLAGPYSIGSELWPGLSKLTEEMGEVGQVVGKLIATHGDPTHWDGSDLRQRLKEELADLLAAISFVTDKSGLHDDEFKTRCKTKRTLFEKWHREQS